LDRTLYDLKRIVQGTKSAVTTDHGYGALDNDLYDEWRELEGRCSEIDPSLDDDQRDARISKLYDEVMAFNQKRSARGLDRKRAEAPKPRRFTLEND